MLRVLHVTCEVEVEPQFTLYDEEGSFLGRADLWLLGTNAVHDYDGRTTWLGSNNRSTCAEHDVSATTTG